MHTWSESGVSKEINLKNPQFNFLEIWSDPIVALQRCLNELSQFELI